MAILKTNVGFEAIQDECTQTSVVGTSLGLQLPQGHGHLAREKLAVVGG